MTDLVTHSEVVIDRPAAAIWPHIVDPNDWKQGAKLWHHTGPAGRRGEIFAAGDPARRDRPDFLIENVELVPNLRRTIKLYLPSGTLLGYATWWLRETNGKTAVGYDVYSESPRAESKTAAGRDSVVAAERAYVAGEQKRFDAELVALKRLVERDPR
jgi:hypothetical protein